MQALIRKITEDRLDKLPFSTLTDWLVFVLVLIVGAFFAHYIYNLGLTLHLVDQYSHLSIARQIADSMTPGLSQIGFWPPLLHILLMPLAAIDPLFQSGLAAAILLVPVLGLAVVLLARLIYLLSGSRAVGYVASLLLLLNPYVLYFSVTPMTEMLFMCMLFGAAYFFVYWWYFGGILPLVLLSLFVSLATLARYEGFILIPVVGIALLIKMLLDKRRYAHIEATAVIFGLLAVTGAAFILVYGYIFGNNPLSFISSSWGAYGQQRDYFLPGEGNVFESFRYMFASVEVMLGQELMVFALVSIVLLGLMLRKVKWVVFLTLFILASPFLFDVLAVYQGSAIVYLPSLPPYPEQFFNVRYGLFAVGVIAIIPAVIAGKLAPRRLSFRNTISTGFFLSAVVLGLLSFSIFDHGRSVGCEACFEVVRKSNQVSPGIHSVVAKSLRDNYKGGHILMTRALHNQVAVEAGIPLENFILEANDFYYKQAVDRPWWYARYVVMYNPNQDVHSPWFLEHEAVSNRWAGDNEFDYFYYPLLITETEAIYALDVERLRDHAREHGLEESWIPVLSNKTQPWDVEVTHLQIERTFEQWHADNS